MPTIRPYKVIDDEYESQSSYTIDLKLPTSGILSSLMLMVKARTATTGDCSGPWIKYLISKISINQAGQQALNAAPPEVFQADAYYKTGKMPRRGYEVMGGAASEVIEEVPILFGDKLNDMYHTIDLSKLNDPKLSITYDLASTGPFGETVWDTTYYPRFSVIAHLLQGAGVPGSLGYHSLRTIESYTPSNSEKKKIELKGKRPIKRIYCQLDKKTIEYHWIHSIDEVKLWGDNEAYIPFIMKPDDWYELIKDIYGLCEVDAYVYYATSHKYVDMCVDHIVSSFISLPQNILQKATPSGGSGRHTILEIYTMSTGAIYSTPTQAMYRFAGYCPWTTMAIDMEKMLGMEYLDPTQHAPLYLELDHTSVGAAIGGPVKIHIEDIIS